MRVHLVDGTYELFRYHFAPGGQHQTADGREVGATRGVLGTLLQLIGDGATHVAVATDHVIESWRNDLYDDYKDGSGIDPDLFQQFPLIEDVMRLAGFQVWPMITHEADDALAAGAVLAAEDARVEQAIICTPDKDLGQCVREDGRIVQYDRRKQKLIDYAAVIDKFGVPPESIPDYLGLVGDTADGFPGLAGWGAKSTAAVLSRYGHIENIPLESGQWDITVRGGAKLASTLAENLDLALLFRRIATVDLDIDDLGTVDDMEWTGPIDGFDELCASVDAERQAERAHKLAAARSART